MPTLVMSPRAAFEENMPKKKAATTAGSITSSKPTSSMNTFETEPMTRRPIMIRMIEP